MSKDVSVEALPLLERKELVLSVLYSFLIFFIPFFVHQQLITGPIINALLLLSFLHIGKSKAYFLALIPSTVALSRGLLPMNLAPMVPFIMISNCLYIEVFSRLKNNGFLAIFVASALKTLFLFTISKLLMEKILAAALASKIATMMSWPQLATALLGGALALLVEFSLKKKYARE